MTYKSNLGIVRTSLRLDFFTRDMRQAAGLKYVVSILTFIQNKLKLWDIHTPE